MADANPGRDLKKNEHQSGAYFKHVVEFVLKYRWIYDLNMTKIFCVDNLNLSKIPKEWRDALLKLSNVELNEVPFGYFKESWPVSLKEFLRNTIEFGAFRFKNANMSSHYDGKILVPPSLQRGMTPKKLLEVTELSKEIAKVCEATGCTAVLDIGSGLGYLGQVLHLNFGYYIMGIEGDRSHCEKANSRQDKIVSCPNIQSKVVFLSENTNDIRSQEELCNILNNANNPVACKCALTQTQTPSVPDLSKGWVLVALHACGPLTPLILQLFAKNRQFKGLVCVGCCYHKFYKNESTINFPTSGHLKWVFASLINHYKLNENIVFGLRLASQETKSRWREKTAENHQEHILHLGYRGILEAFLENSEEECPWKKPLRRMPKSAYKSFKTYYSKALINHGESFVEENKERIEDVLKKFEYLFPLLEVFTLLQVLLQPVWESLILMDRCHYLKENGFDFTIKNFVSEDASPRNLAIVSFQNLL